MTWKDHTNQTRFFFGNPNWALFLRLSPHWAPDAPKWDLFSLARPFETLWVKGPQFFWVRLELCRRSRGSLTGNMVRLTPYTFSTKSTVSWVWWRLNRKYLMINHKLMLLVLSKPVALALFWSKLYSKF